MTHASAYERATILSVMRAAILSGQTSALPALRAQLPSRDWAATHNEDGSITLNDAAMSSYGERSVTMINPTERAQYTNRYHRGWGAYVLWFGVYGWTQLHVYATDLEDAVEKCAEWLAEHAPGRIITQEEHFSLVREACEDAGLAWPPPDNAWEDGAYARVLESSEEDLTYTESGYLTSYEWGVALVNPSTEELHSYIWGL